MYYELVGAADEHRRSENEWCVILANELRDKGVTAHLEYRLPCGSRVDILTKDIAWEVDWAPKWCEGVAQSVYYGLSTDRKPGLWLLKSPDDDEDYVQCLMVCRHLKIELRVTEI